MEAPHICPFLDVVYLRKAPHYETVNPQAIAGVRPGCIASRCRHGRPVRRRRFRYRHLVRALA